MTLKARLFNVLPENIKEAVESSKEIINSNVVPSFDDMGMSSVTPGEFAQEEITDQENLVNKANMSNDTDFNKEGCDCNKEKGLSGAVLDMLNDVVDISEPESNEASVSSVEIIKSEEKPEEEYKKHHGSRFGKFVENALGGKTCEEYLTEYTLRESNYAGPRDFTPDLRISTADVLNTLKNKIGKGAEAIHVDQEYDEDKNNMYKVSQIDKKLLPQKLQVENVLLELDGDCYKVNKPSDSFPLSK